MKTMRPSTASAAGCASQRMNGARVASRSRTSRCSRIRDSRDTSCEMRRSLLESASAITADVVEIDPAVVRFAQQNFGFSTAGEIHVEDARTFVARTDRRYDLIVH